MRKLSIFLATVFLGGVLIPVGVVSAQSDRVLTPVNVQRHVQVAPDIRPIDRCVVVQKNIKKVMLRVENAAKNKNERHKNITVKVERIIKLAEEFGVDASKLKEDLRILNAKMERFNTEVRELLQILQTTHDLACSDRHQAFQDALQKSRTQLGIVKKAAADVRQFINGTLIPDAREVISEILS